MKIIRTEISPLINNSLYLDFKERPYLSSINNVPNFHEHPELQLTFILEGFGKRIIGNNVSHFEPGDMVFIGSYVPHVWLSAPAFFKEGSLLNTKSITVYIDPKVFQQMFDSLREMDCIKEMISQASKGINIYGETRKIIAQKLIELCSKTGFEKIEGLLHIMNLISVSTEKNQIIQKDIDTQTGQYIDRLISVMEYIKANFQEQITLKDVSEVSCMTIQSFCRFFKNRTKKTFSEYLRDIRINHAFKLLIKLDRPIADIANLCGFVSHSHFCKVFKDYTGQSPYQYKNSINSEAI
jgi:AraC-like DNA-binding protein